MVNVAISTRMWRERLNKQLKTLKRTVALTSLPLTGVKIETLSFIYQVYGRILRVYVEKRD